MFKPTARPLLALAALAAAAIAPSAGAAVAIDSFTSTDSTVPFPIVDEIGGVASPISDAASGVFGGGRVLGFGAIPIATGTPDSADFTGQSATLDLDTVAGTLSASATERVGFALVLSYSRPDAPTDRDASAEDRARIRYAASGDLTVTVTLGNLNPTTGLRTGGNFSADLPLPAGSGVFDVSFADLTGDFRGFPAGPNAPTLPPVDLTSLDFINLEFRSVSPGSSVVLSDFALVPEPASAAMALGVAVALTVRRRRRA